MDRLQRISQLHDETSRGYREFGEGIGHYGVPDAFRTITEQHTLPIEKWSVLDLGCGPGNLADYTHFKKYDGVDLSPKMLAEAGESGYQQLTEANIADYVANPYGQGYDAVVALSCAYFLKPSEYLEFMKNVDRLAKRFWLVTLDGITPSLRAIYKRENGIDTYDHRGTTLPWSDTHCKTINGWRSVATEEDIPMDLIYRIK